MSTFTTRKRAATFSRLVCAVAALAAFCTAKIARPRETNWGTKRNTCDTIKVTVGSRRPNSIMVRWLSKQAE